MAERKIKMKADVSTKIYKDVFGIKENHFMVNKTVKAVIINFGDERGDIIVKNDNYGTKRKYADFTNGKIEAGLHPMQIVFSGIEEAIMSKQKYIGADDQVHVFGEENKMYIVRDKEAGNVIDSFSSMAEALEAIQKYEEEDKADGCFSEEFYEVVEEE